MGKTYKKKHQSQDHLTAPSAATVVSAVDCISVEDCIKNKQTKDKLKRRTRTDRLNNDDDEKMDTDTQLKELKENLFEPVDSASEQQSSYVPLKAKKSSSKEGITQSMAARNVTVDEPIVGKSKKRKHLHSNIDEENAMQSVKLVKSGKKVNKLKQPAVVSDISSSDASTGKKKSKKSSESAKNINSSITSITEIKKTVKPASSRKSNKQLDSETKTDENCAKTVPVDSTAKYHALEYLRRWKLQRGEWSFQKVRQVWLLKNMYDETRVSSEDFNILVDYLEDLVGKARQSTVECAEKMMAKAEDEETSDGPTAVSEEKFDRLRRVIQTLS